MADFRGRRMTAKQALLIIGDYESSAFVPDDERVARIVGGILGHVPRIDRDDKSVEKSLKRHSISDSTLKRLPWLLERPVLLASPRGI